MARRTTRRLYRNTSEWEYNEKKKQKLTQNKDFEIYDGLGNWLKVFPKTNEILFIYTLLTITISLQ